MLGWPWILSNARLAKFFQLDSWPSVTRLQDLQEEKKLAAEKSIRARSFTR
jgi:hypothetical protein